MTQSTIRCLSVRQPYAWAICTGIKRPENRTWSTDYRGLVAIHASSSKTLVNSLVKRAKGAVKAETFPTGVIIGAAMLTDVVALSRELEADPYASGPLCLLFGAPKLFATPIPLKGKLNLFNLPEELSQAVRQSYEAASKSTVGDAEREIASFIQDDDLDVNIWRTQSYAHLGQWADAVRCCTNALGLKPDCQMAFRMRAYCYCEQGRCEEGLTDVNAALALMPDDAASFLVRSDIYERMGNVDAAATDYARAIELNPALAEPEADGEPVEQE